MKFIYMGKKRWRIGSLLGCLIISSSLSYAGGNKVLSESATTSKDLTSIPQSTNKASRIIKGSVISSEDNLPIIGANVWVKNGTEGAITDIDGNFSIKVEGIAPVLTFSYVGMATTEVAVSEKLVMNIILSPDSEHLDEVVVVGFGSQKKESVVGAISTIDVTNLKTPSSTVSNALAGQLAGVVAMTRSGEPGKGSSSEFYIRGVSSFKGTSKPLILVDGIERDLDLLDTDDIATFSILKDASASAVYGVRGANGVIIITTRKGVEGKPKISVRAEAGITQPTKMPKMVNSMQWAELYNEALGREYYSAEEIQKYATNADPDLYPNVNWIDELYRNHASNQRINLNITGGGSIAKYYISGAYYNEGSIFKNAGDRYDYNSSINYNKFNFRANIDLALTKSTTVNVNLANIYEKSFRPSSSTSSIWEYSFMTSPNAFPVEYSDGTISAPASASGFNPWNLLVHSGYSEQFWNSSQSLIGLNQDLSEIITPGLTAQIKFSWDAYNTSTQTRSKEPRQYHATGRDPETGSLIFDQIYAGSEQLSYSRSTDGTMTTYLEGSINYSRLFADKHRIGGLLLYNHKIHVRTQDNDKFLSLPYKNQGVAGRATYAYDDKYFAEVNVGYNGSENFARGRRFGFFPAGAIGWMVSNEDWWQSLNKSIDMFKLKASYGKVGNDAIGGGRRWMYEPTIVNGGSWNYGDAGTEGGQGIRVGDVENLNVSWEEALKFNAGIEISLFDKLKIQADYFNESRKGIFLQRDGLPAIVGIQNVPYTNIGETKNQGFDGTMEYSQKVGEVYLTARANFTYNRNKLINNDQPDWQYKYQNVIGKPFGSGGAYQPFGLVAIGLFESQEEIDSSPKQTFGEYRVGDVKYQDINGDGKIDSHDRIAIGYTNIPEIVYGFGTTANWKNIDVNVFFQGVSHVSFFMGGTSIYPFSTGNMGRAAINADIYKHVWKTTNTVEQNANAIYPRLSTGGGVGSSNNQRASTATLRDGSFLRLKNLEVGYSLPKNVLRATFLSNLRVYMAGNNLLTFSKFKLWDPERGNGDGSGYPPSKIVSLGMSANF
ncbi:MAG: SusC/RagA family TonB-linked outer membrane protein [Bacteroidales bacterium]